LNAITEGKYIIFGAGATHLLNAAVHALSSNAASSPAKVVASIPYYPVKLNTTVPYITSLVTSISRMKDELQHTF